MAVSLRWAGILLILLITPWKADAVERGFYSALEPGQNITGKIGREIKTRTELECSTRLYYFYLSKTVEFICHIPHFSLCKVESLRTDIFLFIGWFNFVLGLPFELWNIYCLNITCRIFNALFIARKIMIFFEN